MELMKKHKPSIWWAERGHISKAIGPFLKKRMFETRTHCRIEEVTPVANKVQRSQSMIGRMAMKKVYFPKVSSWGIRAVDELLKFPNARHDDFVDTLSWIGMGLGELNAPRGYIPTDNFPKVGPHNSPFFVMLPDFISIYPPRNWPETISFLPSK